MRHLVCSSINDLGVRFEWIIVGGVAATRTASKYIFAGASNLSRLRRCGDKNIMHFRLWGILALQHRLSTAADVKSKYVMRGDRHLHEIVTPLNPPLSLPPPAPPP